MQQMQHSHRCVAPTTNELEMRSVESSWHTHTHAAAPLLPCYCSQMLKPTPQCASHHLWQLIVCSLYMHRAWAAAVSKAANAAAAAAAAAASPICRSLWVCRWCTCWVRRRRSRCLMLLLLLLLFHPSAGVCGSVAGAHAG
jgi:hypothetical protein